MILASESPRRKEILEKAGFTFQIIPSKINEDFDDDYPVELVAELLAERKATHLQNQYPDELIIAADTIVVLENQILGKPQNREEAFQMIKKLSGNTHTVITGVCVLNKYKIHLFSDFSDVTFLQLSNEQIYYYIDHFPPYDKAGSYGVQDWIGMVAIEKINGSFYNVMGLPIHKLFPLLKGFENQM